MNPGSDIIPYEPYHPHLGYTLLITSIAWLCLGFYHRRRLQSGPGARAMFCLLAIGLPFLAEGLSFAFFLLRPAPETPVGYVLTHFHAYVVNRLPIDTFFSVEAASVLFLALAVLIGWSLARYGYGTLRLRRMLDRARTLDGARHAVVQQRLAAISERMALPLPPVHVLCYNAPLAFTTGILSPSIYISDLLLNLLTPDEAVAVVCHEWAHVVRRDNFWSWMARLLRDTAWVLPGSHYAWRKLTISQDEACDLLATEMTQQPLALARALVKVSAAWQGRSFPAVIQVAASSFASGPNGLQSRVEQMLLLHGAAEGSRERRAAGPYLVGFGLVVLAVLPSLLGS